MFSFLLDILQLDLVEAEKVEGGGGGTAQIITEKIEFIRERIPADKSPDFPGRQFEITKNGIDRKESKPFQNCFIWEFERIKKLCKTVTLTLTTLNLMNLWDKMMKKMMKKKMLLMKWMIKPWISW